MMRKYKSDNSEDATNSIIRNHIVWSMGAGLIPLPIADVAAVSAVQLDMIKQMSRVHDVDFNEMQGKSLITTLVGSSMARIGASAVKLLPGIGTLVGGVAMPVLSGASTYALGQVFRQHFETGGTFLDFDVDRLRKYYAEQFEKGKKVAEDIQKEEDAKVKSKTSRRSKTPPEDTATPTAESVSDEEVDSMDAALRKLQDLANLRDNKVITEAEFKEMKKKMMERF